MTNPPADGPPAASAELPPADLRARVEERVGRARFRLANRWSPASSVVWRVDIGGAPHALKAHATPEGFRRERAAYEAWLPRAARPIAPRLVAAFDGPSPALLLTWVEGATLLESRALDVSQELAVYASAGRALRALHEVPYVDADAAARPDRVRETIRARVEALRDVLPAAVAAWALRTADSRAWGDQRIGPCHRDSSPRNWLVVPPGGPDVVLIDFEHAEIDFLGTDAMKLWDGPFIGRPDRRGAFFGGYGLPLADAVREARLLAPAHGLSIVQWSRRNGDPDYEAHGLAFLSRAACGEAWVDE